MRKTIIVLVFGLLIMSIPLQAAQAQETPHIFDSTMPINADLRADLDAWLAIDNPSSASYYAVTYARPDGFDMLVSLAGFDDITDGWSITGDARGVSHVVWLGSVRVTPDGTVELFPTSEQAQSYDHPGGRMAAPSFESLQAGGGDTIYFPLDAAKSFQYGILGVHAAGYANSGFTGDMVAVDLVSGLDMGQNFASPWVWASAPGEVVYVCEDSDSTAVVIESANGNRFLYAHLEQNDTLTLQHAFSPRASLGGLVMGTFGAPNAGCGWADQRPLQYHLHWGIEPANGVFRAESCVLRVSTDNWTCGSEVIGPTEYLTGRGVNNATDPYTSPTLFDYLLGGVLNIYDKAIVQQLPDGSSDDFPLTRGILNSVSVVLRVVNVLIMGNLNLTPTIGLWIVAINFRLFFGVIWLVAIILRTIKMIPSF